MFLAWGIVSACASSPPAEESVHPGINEGYLDPELVVDEWTARFEVESREIYSERVAIADAIGLEPGDEVADVGAGTGLFLSLLSERVGPEGRVVAVDIAPKFVEHLRERARSEGLANVEVHLGGERSVGLPADSVDAVLLCDVYHHLEFPRSTMGSVHDALRDGGEVLLVDFERIPGVSREWTLNHVRAGKDVIRTEMASFGFELVEELELAGLEENYVLRFRKG